MLHKVLKNRRTYFCIFAQVLKSQTRVSPCLDNIPDGEKLILSLSCLEFHISVMRRSCFPVKTGKRYITTRSYFVLDLYLITFAIMISIQMHCFWCIGGGDGGCGGGGE